jgi:hypothetical protein
MSIILYKNCVRNKYRHLTGEYYGPNYENYFHKYDSMTGDILDCSGDSWIGTATEKVT